MEHYMARYGEFDRAYQLVDAPAHLPLPDLVVDDIGEDQITLSCLVHIDKIRGQGKREKNGTMVSCRHHGVTWSTVLQEDFVSCGREEPSLPASHHEDSRVSGRRRDGWEKYSGVFIARPWNGRLKWQGSSDGHRRRNTRDR